MTAEAIQINTAKVVSENVDGVVIVINLETGAYYQLVESGVDAWNLLQRGVSRPEFLTAMSSYYSEDPAVVEQAAAALLEDLKQEEIVVFAEAGGAAAELPEGPAKGPLGKLQLEKFTNMSDLLLLDPIHDVDEQGWPHNKGA